MGVEEGEGEVFWHSLLPDGTPVQICDAVPLTARTVVIGCGLTGLSCAWTLASAEAKLDFETQVVALDARGIGDGATGRNGGHHYPEVAEETESRCSNAEQLAEVEKHDGKELVKFLESVQDEDKLKLIGWRETGGVLITSDPKDVPFFQATAASSSLEFLDAKALQELRLVRGSEFCCGLGNPKAVQFCPGGLLLALTEQAKAKGARIVTNTRVCKIERVNGKSLWRVETAHGQSIVCQNVVHASNAYGLELLPSRVRKHLQAIKGQAIAAEMPTGTAPRSILYECNPDSKEEYLIQRQQDGMVIFGGCRHVAAAQGENCGNEHVDPKVVENLLVELARLFPGVPLKLKNRWAGTMCFTPDHNPLVGRLKELDGQYLSVGYSGHGMVRAFSCGRFVAEQILQRPHSLPAIGMLFHPDRFEDV